MNYLTAAQYDSLRKTIYMSFMANPELGMGEMGPAEEEAKMIVDEWMMAEGLKIVG